MISRKPLEFADTPAQFTVAEAAAVKAVSTGTATPEQQKAAFDWIIKNAGGIGAQSYRPGDSHATAFMEGRRFVASQLVAIATINIEELKKRTT